jgi:hypothetical protein
MRLRRTLADRITLGEIGVLPPIFDARGKEVICAKGEQPGLPTRFTFNK